MKFKFKKYIYLLNDATNAILNKDKRQEDKRVRNLVFALIILAVVLITSLAVNVYFVTGA